MKALSCWRSPSVWNSRLDPFWEALAAALKTGAPSLLSHVDGDPHEHEAADHVEKHVHQQRPDGDDRQHVRVSVLRLVRTRSDTLNR